MNRLGLSLVVAGALSGCGQGHAVVDSTSASAASSGGGTTGRSTAGSTAGSHGATSAGSTGGTTASSTAGSSSTTASSTATSTTTTTTTASSSTGTTGAACAGGCGQNARCVDNACTCIPGFDPSGADCVAETVTESTTHSQADVCARWQAGHVERANPDYTAGANTCDPGTLSDHAKLDALLRLNTFRWLAGLGPTWNDPVTLDVDDQACSVISANNPVSGAAHFPTAASACFTPAGQAGAGSSNIAWGSGSAAGAMDQWVQDYGNDTTLGHRRWILHPSLAPVGLGFYRGGNAGYGSASCLGVFGGGNPGPVPAFYAWPPAGVVPADAVYPTWSLHSGSYGVGGATVTVTRSDGVDLPVAMHVLTQGYGDETTSWTFTGTAPAAGDTVTVHVTGASGHADFDYSVHLVSCP